MRSVTQETNRIYKLWCFLILSAFMLTGTLRGNTQANVYFTPLAWSADGNRVAVAIANLVEVREAGTGEILYRLVGHSDFIPDVEWSPDNQMIATASYDHTARIWNAHNGSLLHILEGHHEPITAITWLPDASRLVSSGFENQPNLFIWSVETGLLLNTYNSGVSVDISFNIHGDRFAAITPLSIGIRDARTYERLSRFRYSLCCENVMYSLAWSPNGSMLVTGSQNGLVTLWDAETLQITSQFAANNYTNRDGLAIPDADYANVYVRDVTFTPDGASILAVSGDGTIRQWDVATGTLVQETQIAPLAAASWSPYGGRLAYLDVEMLQLDQSNLTSSEVASRFHISVPNPSIELLNAIYQTCAVDAANPESSLLPNTVLTQTALPQVIRQIETLPRNSILPACQADLLAVAEALRE